MPRESRRREVGRQEARQTKGAGKEQQQWIKGRLSEKGQLVLVAGQATEVL